MVHHSSQSAEGMTTRDGPYMGMVQRFGGSWHTTLTVGLVTILVARHFRRADRM